MQVSKGQTEREKEREREKLGSPRAHVFTGNRAGTHPKQGTDSPNMGLKLTNCEIMT